ncbi:hypothetical protein [Thermocrinis sp.]
MKKDLSHLILQTEPGSAEEFKDYLVDYVLDLIIIELESLPKEQWDKTLQTWKKIFILSHGLMKKPADFRERFYQSSGFDGMMRTIVENLIEAFKKATALGLLEKSDSPTKLLILAVERAESKGMKLDTIKHIKNALMKEET